MLIHLRNSDVKKTIKKFSKKNCVSYALKNPKTFSMKKHVKMKLEIWMVRVVRNYIKNLDFLIKVSFIYRAVHQVLQALPLWWGAKQQNS